MGCYVLGGTGKNGSNEEGSSDGVTAVDIIIGAAAAAGAVLVIIAFGGMFGLARRLRSRRRRLLAASRYAPHVTFDINDL